jgi:hypothetical protein
MELNPSQGATSQSATQDFPKHFMEPESAMACIQEPSICPYPEPDNSSLYQPTIFPFNAS